MKKPTQFKYKKSEKTKKCNLYDTHEWYTSTEWHKYRKIFLHHNPKCYVCGGKSGVVEHLRPHRGIAEVFENIKNHIPCCKPCHDTITALFDRHLDWTVEEVFKKKLEWLGLNRKVVLTIKVIPQYRRKQNEFNENFIRGLADVRESETDDEVC
jgi:hypothetical protein